MFKWIKESLFGSNRGYAEGSTVLPETRNIPPMSEVEPPKKPDISEPVYVLVANINKHPSHWKIKESLSWTQSTSIRKTGIKDLKSREEFLVLKEHFFDGYSTTAETFSKNLSWANENEIKALKEVLEDCFNKKKKRVDSIKQIKKDNERKRLMELYK